MKEYICIRLILSLSAVQLCSEMNVAVLVRLETPCQHIVKSKQPVCHQIIRHQYSASLPRHHIIRYTAASVCLTRIYAYQTNAGTLKVNFHKLINHPTQQQKWPSQLLFDGSRDCSVLVHVTVAFISPDKSSQVKFIDHDGMRRDDITRTT